MVEDLTKKQLAQKRNYFKFILSGMLKPFDPRVLSLLEIDEWNKMMESRAKLLKNFDATSNQAGLTIHNKCWCKRIIKNNKKYCKHHEE